MPYAKLLAAYGIFNTPYFYKRKSFHAGSIFVWIIYLLLQILFKTSLPLPPLLILLLNLILSFTLCQLCCNSSICQSAIFSVLVCSIWLLAEITVGVALRVFKIGGDTEKLAGAAFSELIVFAAALLAGQFFNQQKRQIFSLPYTFCILFVPAASIYLIHHIFQIGEKHEQYRTFAIGSCLVLITMNIIIFEVFEKISRDADIKKKNFLYEQQLELCRRQSEERENAYAHLRQLRHDMKHHLSTLQTLIDHGQTSEASTYMQMLLSSSRISRSEDISHTGNLVIDALINDRYAYAAKNGIRFQTNLNIPDRLSLNAGHLTIILGNLLDNALEACLEFSCPSKAGTFLKQNLVESGAPWIKLAIHYGKGLLTITVQNPYIGSRIPDSNGHFHTTKSNPQSHGLGLYSVEQASACCGGTLITKAENKIFEATVLIYENNSEQFFA